MIAHLALSTLTVLTLGGSPSPKDGLDCKSARGGRGASSRAESWPPRDRVVDRPTGPWYSVAAHLRLGILLAGGAEVIQPVGFGAGLEIRIHALRLGPIRLGGLIHFGHTRFIERRSFQLMTEGDVQRVTRYAALGHTDFSLGPSLQVPLGPVFIEAGVGVGVAISTFYRPLGAMETEVETFDDTSAMLQGGGQLVVPIRKNQGILVGITGYHFFSSLQIVAEPPEPPLTVDDVEPDTNPFDTILDVHIGYHFMF